MEKIPSNSNTLIAMRWLYIMLLLCSCRTALSVSFTATPDRLVLGDSGTLTLTCSVTESDVSQVYNIKIKRAVTPGSTSDELVASFVSDTAMLDDGITDDKGFSVTGNLNGASSVLEVTMDRSKLTCFDARFYKCETSYDSTTTGNVEIVSSNLTIQTFVLPQMVPPLQAKRNGVFVEGGTQSNRAIFEVGDQLEVRCRANIGSINSTKIRWGKTSEKDSGQFMNYQPQEGSYDEGTPLSDNMCGYTRTATLKYNITTHDGNYSLAFECYVSVSGYPSSTLTPSGVYTTNHLRYYVEVLRETTTSATDVVTTCACSTNVAALAAVAIGSVIATLTVVGIILVVIKCLRMQKGKQKEKGVGISMNYAATDTHHVYINEEQHQASNLHHAATVEYEVLQESARESNTYSDLRKEQ